MRHTFRLASFLSSEFESTSVNSSSAFERYGTLEDILFPLRIIYEENERKGLGETFFRDKKE